MEINEKEPLFRTDETESPKSFYETMTGLMTKADKVTLFLLYFSLIMLIAAAILFAAIGVIKPDKKFIFVFSSVFFILSAVYFMMLLPRMRCKSFYKQFLKKNGGNAESSTLFYEDSFVIVSKTEAHTYSYEKITHIVDTGRSVIIRIDNAVNSMAVKDTFTVGNPEELYAFLLPKIKYNEKTPGKVVLSLVIYAIFCIFLAIAVLAGIVMLFGAVI